MIGGVRNSMRDVTGAAWSTHTSGPYMELYRKRWAYKDVNVGRLDNGELLSTEKYRIQSLRDACSDGVELSVYPEWRSCRTSHLLD